MELVIGPHVGIAYTTDSAITVRDKKNKMMTTRPLPKFLMEQLHKLERDLRSRDTQLFPQLKGRKFSLPTA